MGPHELDLFFKRLFALRCPKVIILLVLLVSWMEDDEGTQTEYGLIEYFSGVGRVAQMAEMGGIHAVAYDFEYSMPKVGKRRSMDMNSSAGLVLAIKLILRSRFNQLVSLFATCCSSWTPVNRGTGKRCIITPHGDEQVPSVRKSNKLVSRSVILMLLTVASGGTILLENPSNSLIALHDRYVWLVQLLLSFQIYMYKTAFWMKKHGGMTWKRTWMWGSSPHIECLDLGPLLPAEKPTEVRTTKTWIDKDGKKRWQGTDQLKGTQRYTYRFAANVIRLVPHFIAAKPYEALPPVSKDHTVLELFNMASYEDTWDPCCDLEDVLIYLRGSKRLRIPNDAWRAALPKRLPLG
ncbi:unnamed protein product [Durusdinium trenchii]|uniref:Uncharacterized protein n=1 Tax=Durusdinium trenchii TaxID=1381693 RepID=A0ABP0RNK4_9DINO